MLEVRGVKISLFDNAAFCVILNLWAIYLQKLLTTFNLKYKKTNINPLLNTNYKV